MITIFLFLFANNRNLVTFVSISINTIYMTKKVKEVIDLLEENGWKCVRTKGSHRIFVKDGARRSIAVPGKPGNDMPVGTLKSILRESGLE